MFCKTLKFIFIFYFEQQNQLMQQQQMMMMFQQQQKQMIGNFMPITCSSELTKNLTNNVQIEQLHLTQNGNRKKDEIHEN